MSSGTSPKPGDVVMLRSGGPKMTVVAIQSGRVACIWSDGNAVVEKDFAPIALTVTKGEDQ